MLKLWPKPNSLSHYENFSIGLFSLFNFSHLRLTVFWFLFRCCLHSNSIWAQKIDLSIDKPIYSSFALKPFTHRDYIPSISIVYILYILGIIRLMRFPFSAFPWTYSMLHHFIYICTCECNLCPLFTCNSKFNFIDVAAAFVISISYRALSFSHSLYSTGASPWIWICAVACVSTGLSWFMIAITVQL